MFRLLLNPKTRKDPLLPSLCLWRSSFGKPFRLSYVLELPINSTLCLGLTLGLLLISHTHTTKFVHVTCIYSVSLLEEELLITSQNFYREISILNYFFLRFLGAIDLKTLHKLISQRKWKKIKPKIKPPTTAPPHDDQMKVWCELHDVYIHIYIYTLQ
jgi:hypothetical protein